MLHTGFDKAIASLHPFPSEILGKLENINKYIVKAKEEEVKVIFRSHSSLIIRYVESFIDSFKHFIPVDASG